MFNRYKLLISIIVIVFLVGTIFVSIRSKNISSVSEYHIIDMTNNSDYVPGEEIPYVYKTIKGQNLTIGNLKGNQNLIFGSIDEDEVLIEKEWVSDRLASVIYYPENNIIYEFGKDKPINIMIGTYATDSGDPYESPLYIGYSDGTCEYPAEFDYVRIKKKCSQHLQDTLDFVGYDTVDEMLEDAFGDYITKEDVENKVAN